jgi:hypothetical protein
MIPVRKVEYRGVTEFLDATRRSELLQRAQQQALAVR